MKIYFKKELSNNNYLLFTKSLNMDLISVFDIELSKIIDYVNMTYRKFIRVKNEHRDTKSSEANELLLHILNILDAGSNDDKEYLYNIYYYNINDTKNRPLIDSVSNRVRVLDIPFSINYLNKKNIFPEYTISGNSSQLPMKHCNPDWIHF